MFNTRNKSGISAHLCVILYIFGVNDVIFHGVNDLMFFFFSSHSLTDIQAVNICFKLMINQPSPVWRLVLQVSTSSRNYERYCCCQCVT